MCAIACNTRDTCVCSKMLLEKVHMTKAKLIHILGWRVVEQPAILAGKER